MRRIVVLALFACSACAHVEPTQSWAELRQRLAPGRPISVADAHGTEVQGKVSAVSASALTLNVDDDLRRFDAADVREVRRNGDPLWNGFAIGAGVGVLGAFLPDNRCSGQPLRCDDRQIPQRVAFLAAATAVGVAIDALHRDRTVLYRSPARAIVRLVPSIGVTRHSISIAVSTR